MLPEKQQASDVRIINEKENDRNVKARTTITYSLSFEFTYNKLCTITKRNYDVLFFKIITVP